MEGRDVSGEGLREEPGDMSSGITFGPTDKSEITA
jgi:hypothetical protein